MKLPHTACTPKGSRIEVVRSLAVHQHGQLQVTLDSYGGSVIMRDIGFIQ